MPTFTSKIQLATAVIAVTATALAPVALADDTDATSTDTATASVGSAAGSAPTRSTRKDRPTPTNPFSGPQTSPSTGSSAGSTSTPSTGAATPDVTPDRASTAVDAGTPAATAGADAAAPSAVGANPLFQNPLIWIGQPNPNPPVSTPIYEFQPLGNLPEFTRPMFGWMEGFDFEACVLGLGTTVRGQTVVGPYGTSTTGVSTSGCA